MAQIAGQFGQRGAISSSRRIRSGRAKPDIPSNACDWLHHASIDPNRCLAIKVVTQEGQEGAERLIMLILRIIPVPHLAGDRHLEPVAQKFGGFLDTIRALVQDTGAKGGMCAGQRMPQHSEFAVAGMVLHPGPDLLLRFDRKSDPVAPAPVQIRPAIGPLQALSPANRQIHQGVLGRRHTGQRPGRARLEIWRRGAGQSCRSAQRLFHLVRVCDFDNGGAGFCGFSVSSSWVSRASTPSHAARPFRTSSSGQIVIADDKTLSAPDLLQMVLSSSRWNSCC